MAAQGGSAGAAAQEVLPDLRIVRIEVEPATVVDGATATLRLMLHNASAAVAAGDIAVEVVHDRRAPQPLPVRQQVLYMGPDALAQVEFTLPTPAIGASPYTFFAKVDVDDAVREADESNNTAWLRVAVCGGAERAEVADGFDNDCDGMIDEELGLPADPQAAIRMLRALQERSRIDAAPLLYALARPVPLAPVEWAAHLLTEEGYFIGRPPPQPGRRRGAAPDDEVVASLQEGDPRAWLRIIDWNGGTLRSGDLVGLRDGRGDAIIAAAGGGNRVLVRAPYRIQEEVFTVILTDGARGAPIGSGDAVALVSFNGLFLSAEEGGGGALRANRSAAAGWETFVLRLEPPVDGR